MSITTAQIRGARGILNWSQTELAERTGISATSIGSIENGQTTPRNSTKQTIQKAFEDAGIEFIGTEGVRIKSGHVKVLSGRTGYLEFFDNVYEELEKNPSEVCVSNVDERKFVKWHGDLGDKHLERMSELKGITYRILIREGDTYFPASDYAEYRWLPKEQFTSVPFYVYGNKLAIMIFEVEPKVIVLDYSAVSAAYRKQFDNMWEHSHRPETQENKKQAGTAS